MKSSRFGLVLIVILVLAAALLALFGPSLFNSTPKATESFKEAMPHLKPISLAAKGVVESEQEIELSSRVKGEISIITVEEGDSVTTGQLLVGMNKHKIAALIELAEAKLRTARAVLDEQSTGFRHEEVSAAENTVIRATAVFEQAAVEAQRQQRLLNKGVIPSIEWERAEEKRHVSLAQLNELKAQLDKFQSGSRTEAIEQARARVAEATAELKYQRAVLADYSVHSPIDGLVIQRHVDADESVDIATPLLTLIAPNQLRIHAEVEETDVGKVTEGQSVELTVDNLQGKIFTGKVYQVFPTVNKKSQRTFDPMASFDINTQKVYIALDDYSGLVHGMTVTVRFLK